MDTLPQNPASKNMTSGPLIDFKDEISKKYKEDFINSRKLTEIPNTPRENLDESSHDIDRQISDLEDLIKRLQDDIIQTSSASSSNNESAHNKLNIQKICNNIVDNNTEDIDPEDQDENEYNPFQIYPLMSVDQNHSDMTYKAGPAYINKEEDNNKQSLILLPVSESKKFDAAVKDLLNLNDDIDEFPTKLSAVRKMLSTVTVTEPKNDASQKDNLQVLIDELKSEISGKMDELKNVDIADTSDHVDVTEAPKCKNKH